MFSFCCLHPCLARWISGVISHGLHVGTHNQEGLSGRRIKKGESKKGRGSEEEGNEKRMGKRRGREREEEREEEGKEKRKGKRRGREREEEGKDKRKGKIRGSEKGREEWRGKAREDGR